MIAPVVINGAINRADFEVHAERLRMPELRPGDVVAVANLSRLKRQRSRFLIEAAGAGLRFLPADSPDVNPIENAFAKLKALLRKVAERTIAGGRSAIGRRMDLFTPAACANDFAAARCAPDGSDSALERVRRGRWCRALS